MSHEVHAEKVQLLHPEEIEQSVQVVPSNLLRASHIITGVVQEFPPIRTLEHKVHVDAAAQ